MLKKIKGKRKNKKKGFTLVELIVVLVILAILAALLVPALTGYIDKAKEKSIIAETRQTVIAAQTLADEEYAETNVKTNIYVVKKAEDIPKRGYISKEDIAALAEVTIENVSYVEFDGGKLTYLRFRKGGKTCEYYYPTGSTDGEYRVTDTIYKN